MKPYTLSFAVFVLATLAGATASAQGFYAVVAPAAPVYATSVDPGYTALAGTHVYAVPQAIPYYAVQVASGQALQAAPMVYSAAAYSQPVVHLAGATPGYGGDRALAYWTVSAAAGSYPIAVAPQAPVYRLVPPMTYTPGLVHYIY